MADIDKIEELQSKNCDLTILVREMKTALISALNPLEILFGYYDFPDNFHVIEEVKSAISKAEGKA